MIFNKMSYLKKTIKAYLRSFTELKLLGIVFILNALLLLSLYFSFYIAKVILKEPLKNLGLVSLENIAMKSAEELNSIALNLRSFFITLITAAIILFLMVLLAVSIFEGIAWCRILKKKFTLKYLGKFTLLNGVWLLSFIALFLLFLMGSKQNTMKLTMLAIIFIFTYFTLLLFFFFTKENKIKKALKTGITKIHCFILPIALITVTYFIITRVKILYQSLSFAFLFNIIIVTLLLAWVKVYMSDTITGIKA